MNYENLTQARHQAERVLTHITLHRQAVRHGLVAKPDVSYRALHEWAESLKNIQSLVTVKRAARTTVKLLFNARRLWVGVHYSPANRRWCVNLLPGVTICITKAGGVEP
ncbi:hypothetical protein Paz_16 [Xylella phage Paz]|uniref:Uncharacterized protein n=1 Tax=Xylella phage Paz TaxID=1415145 RepID=V5Q7P5_9CAUD|nr:hypothetical protein Paz_16 [Xylella phage Paz]AHB12113.1 hypothetical protein Paz_16 [Xylella phage Paz]